MKFPLAFILYLTFQTVTGQTSSIRSWVDSEKSFTDSRGNSVTVTNSLPKGGGDFKNINGKQFSYIVFWTHITNNSKKPLKLDLGFRPDSFPIFKSQGSYIKILLPPDSMTESKIQLGDYGLTDLQTTLDKQSKNTSLLRRTLEANQSLYFYTAVLIHQARGTARAAYSLHQEDFIFKIRIDSDSSSIPSGRLHFKK